MRANSSARAWPAELSGGSPLPSSFSACRTTIMVVESAVAQTQTSHARKLITTSAPSTDSHIGIKNGLCCNCGLFLAMPL
jgi:hypothetical protein